MLDPKARSAPGQIQIFPEDHAINELLLGFVAGAQGAEPKAGGSGVFIAPGIALSACHVVQAYSDHFNGRGHWNAADASPDFAMQALQYLPGQSRPIWWHVVAGSFSDNSDLAVLQLEPDHELERGTPQRYPVLNIEPLIAGTEIQAVGFPDADLTYVAGQGWTLNHLAVGARGQVTQCFPVQRDNASRRYPCFEMNLRTVSGMSGGPVFDAAGHLRGIVCSEFDFADDGPPVEYASRVCCSICRRLAWAAPQQKLICCIWPIEGL